MPSPRTPLLALPLVLLLAGCGTEAGRVPFAAEGTGKTTATLKAGDVALWTDIDIKWEGDAILAYTVELAQGGKTVASATCLPLERLSTRVAWTETNIGASHTRSGKGKLRCSVSLPTGGPTDVTATLAFTRRPATVTMKQADLVVKQ